MSTAKRSRGRPSDVKTASPLPASKRQKTTDTSHVPKPSGLGFLVDDNARAGKKLEARYTNGIARVQPEQSVFGKNKAKITSGDQAHLPSAKQHNNEIIEISSGKEESSEYETDEEDENERTDSHVTPGATASVSHFEDDALLLNGHADEEEVDALAGADDARILVDGQHTDQEEESGGDDEVEKQTFGDQLRARHPEPIDTRDPVYDDSQALVPGHGNRHLTAFSGTSLTTVLTQSLKTNDKSLLERCLQTKDDNSIRATIERLNPQLASQLLQRLAEIIYKRPGRTGHLMTWIQWTLVSQGAYIASQPDVIDRLKVLQRVLKQRASGIEPLLHLKGKLDLLSAQLTARRKLLEESRESEDEEEPTVYEDARNTDAWSESDVEMTGIKAIGQGNKRSRRGKSHTKPNSVHVNGNLQTPSSFHEPAKKTAPPSSHTAARTSAPGLRQAHVLLPNGVKHSDISDMDEDGIDGAVSDDEDEDEEDDEDEDVNGTGDGLIDIEAEEASDEDDSERSSGNEAADDESASSEAASESPNDDAVPARKSLFKRIERKR